MLVFVDERQIVASGYATSFGREGVSLTSFVPNEFEDWVNSAGDHDIEAVEAFLIGARQDRHQFSKIIPQLPRLPGSPMSDQPWLARTPELLTAGGAGGAGNPVHAREMLAGVRAI